MWVPGECVLGPVFECEIPYLVLLLFWSAFFALMEDVTTFFLHLVRNVYYYNI